MHVRVRMEWRYLHHTDLQHPLSKWRHLHCSRDVFVPVGMDRPNLHHTHLHPQLPKQRHLHRSQHLHLSHWMERQHLHHTGLHSELSKRRLLYRTPYLHLHGVVDRVRLYDASQYVPRSAAPSNRMCSCAIHEIDRVWKPDELRWASFDHVRLFCTCTGFYM